MNGRTFRRGVVAAALALAVAVAACGDDDDDGGTTGSAAEGQASGAPSGDPLKIGVVAPNGSPVFNDTWSVAAAQAAARAVNDRGGVAGRPVEIVYCNDKGDPNETAKCAREMVSDEVVATVGGSTFGGAALNPVLNAAKIPQIGLDPQTGPDFSSPNVYLFSGGSLLGFQTLVSYAAHKKVPLAVVGGDNSVTATFIPQAQKILEENGSRLTAKVLVPPKQADFAPLVAAAERNGTEGALIFLGKEQMQQFMAAARARGTDFQYFTPSTVTDIVADPAGLESIGGEATLADATFSNTFPPLNSDNAEMKRYLEEMKAEADAGTAEADTPTLNGIRAWLAVNVIEQVVEDQKVTDVSGATLMEALNATKDLDLGGLIPPWTPNAPGPKGLERVSNQKYFIIGFDGTETTQILDEPVDIATAGGS